MVASQLLKFCHFLEDTEGHRMKLLFIGDTDKREIDFVVIRDKEPVFAVECKTGEASISPALHYFSERTKIPYFYQFHGGSAHRQVNDRIELIPFPEFCKKTSMV